MYDILSSKGFIIRGGETARGHNKPFRTLENVRGLGGFITLSCRYPLSVPLVRFNLSGFGRFRDYPRLVHLPAEPLY